MKRVSLFAASVLVLAVGGVWHVSAQPPAPANKAISARDPLADWQYPGARNQEESNGERLPAIPLHGIRCRTADPIETVYLFYRKKIEPHFAANAGNSWQPNFQTVLMMTQFAQGGETANFFHAPRKDADNALMIIRQPKRTLTIQLSRDPQDKSATDIVLVADEH